MTSDSEIEIDDARIHGYSCECFEDAVERLKRFELEHTVKFVLARGHVKLTGSSFVLLCTDDDDEGTTEFDMQKVATTRIYWQGKSDACCPIPYDGVPFVYNARQVYICQHGTLPNKKTKSDGGDHTYDASKSRVMAEKTMKFGCKARAIMKELIRFPDYSADPSKQSVRTTKMLAGKLKSDVSIGKKVRWERTIHLEIDNNHTGHATGSVAGIQMHLDKKLIERIHELVENGAREVGEVKRSLEDYVRNVLFDGEAVPSENNRRYFPLDRDIRNHIYLSTLRLENPSEDQKKTGEMLSSWRKDGDMYHYRPRTYDDDEEEGILVGGDTFLLLHQTKRQRYLLERYGNEICLLDATHNTTKYSLPLYMVVVKTNVDFQVVAQFITQDETQSTIEEAMQLLKSWNEAWTPRFFMSDNDNAQITALENVFQETRVLLCDFHREQAWERWLSRSENDLIDDKKIVLELLRNTARAETQTEFDGAVASLKESDVWRDSEKLRRYFNTYWLPKAERWAWTYRRGELAVRVDTNNGIEIQNRVLKKFFLRMKNSMALVRMLPIFRSEFLKHGWNRYVEKNTFASTQYRKWTNKDVPEYLYDRPQQFVSHCLFKLDKARTIDSGTIRRTDDSDAYIVGDYDVLLEDERGQPSCTCKSYQRQRMPCKHIFAVIVFREEVSWTSFSETYRNSPFITLDKSVIFHEGPDDDGASQSAQAEPSGTGIKLLPMHGGPISSKERQCSELLKELKSVMYDLKNKRHLSNLRDELETVVKKYSAYRSFEDNLPLSGASQSTKNTSEQPSQPASSPQQPDVASGRCSEASALPERSTDQPEAHPDETDVNTKRRTRPLPKRQPRHPASGRHGAAAAMKRDRVRVPQPLDDDDDFEDSPMNVRTSKRRKLSKKSCPKPVGSTRRRAKEQVTSAPSAATSVPRATTSAPSAATSVPRAATSVPRATTSATRATTSVPRATTSAHPAGRLPVERIDTVGWSAENLDYYTRVYERHAAAEELEWNVQQTMQLQGVSNMCGLCAVNNLLQDEDDFRTLELIPGEVDQLADGIWLQLIRDHGGRVPIPRMRSTLGDYSIEVLERAMEMKGYKLVRLTGSEDDRIWLRSGHCYVLVKVADREHYVSYLMHGVTASEAVSIKYDSQLSQPKVRERFYGIIEIMEAIGSSSGAAWRLAPASAPDHRTQPAVTPITVQVPLTEEIRGIIQRAIRFSKGEEAAEFVRRMMTEEASNERHDKFRRATQKARGDMLYEATPSSHFLSDDELDDVLQSLTKMAHNVQKAGCPGHWDMYSTSKYLFEVLLPEVMIFSLKQFVDAEMAERIYFWALLERADYDSMLEGRRDILLEGGL